MPIPTDTDTMSDAEAAQADAVASNGSAEPVKAKRAPRTRKLAPEGVETGLFQTIEMDTPPPALKAPGTNTRSEDALRVIQTCEQNAGQWFKIGRFGTPSAPQGVWADHGIKFAHRADPDVPGFNLRYAMKPIEGQ